MVKKALTRPEQFKRLRNFGAAYKEYYFLSDHLKEEGDFLICDPMETRAERHAATQYICWWANRNNKVVKIETIWLPATDTSPAGKAIKATLTRNYRYMEYVPKTRRKASSQE